MGPQIHKDFILKWKLDIDTPTSFSLNPFLSVSLLPMDCWLLHLLYVSALTIFVCKMATVCLCICVCSISLQEKMGQKAVF